MKLNVRNKIIIAKDFINENGKFFFTNLELNQITDNKLFWKTIKPFLSDKSVPFSTTTIDNKDN